jgi:hypothetical protein
LNNVSKTFFIIQHKGEDEEKDEDGEVVVVVGFSFVFACSNVHNRQTEGNKVQGSGNELPLYPGSSMES